MLIFLCIVFFSVLCVVQYQKLGTDNNFINILHLHIFRTKVFWAAFLCLEFGFEQTFVQKMR